jgi:P27 family predicted phage terminase small subunit
MKGRKRLPSAIKALHGARRSRIFKEPPTAGAIGEPPEWMTDEQRASWAFAAAHAPRGILRRIDAGVLCVWVVASCLHAEAARRIAKHGVLMRASTKDADSQIVQSPWISIMNVQARVMLRCAEQLGFSPIARPRLGAANMPSETPRAGDEDEEAGESLDEYLERGRALLQ